MNRKEAQKLEHGLYRIHWKSGGASLASVGSSRDGRRWFAPTNWIEVPSYKWAMVERVTILERHVWREQ